MSMLGGIVEQRRMGVVVVLRRRTRFSSNVDVVTWERQQANCMAVVACQVGLRIHRIDELLELLKLLKLVKLHGEALGTWSW